jgi:integrase
MEAKFLLKERESEDRTLILMFFRFSSKRLVYSTGFKVNKANWNFEKQRCYVNRNFRDGKQINQHLDKLASLVLDIYYKFNKSGLNVSDIRQELDRITKGVVQKKGTSFIEYFEYHKDWFIKKYGLNSGKKYGTTYNHLKAFFEYKRKVYDWNDINTSFAEEFEEYLYDQESVNSPNHIATMLAKIKTVMKSGLEKGYHTNTKYSKIKVKEVDVFNVSLNEEELSRIRNFPCTKGIKEVRDLFVIAAYTGLRFSDFIRLKPEHFKGDRIKITTEKTTTEVVIPIHRIVKEIMEERDWQVPKPKVNQIMNKHLKTICLGANINERIVVSKIKKRVKTDEIKEKWELVSTHTARRSFATNLFLSGVPTIAIMKLTGHKTEKAFMKYIKTDGDRNAELLMNSDFFK